MVSGRIGCWVKWLILEVTEESFMEDVVEHRIKKGVQGFQESFDEITMPGATCGRRALEDVVVSFFWSMAGGAAVIIASLAAVEPFACW